MDVLRKLLKIERSGRGNKQTFCMSVMLKVVTRGQYFVQGKGGGDGRNTFGRVGALYVSFLATWLTSPHPHNRILSIDIEFFFFSWM